MKRIILALVLLTSTAQAAEFVKCVNTREEAEVTFTLEGNVATQLRFMHQGNEIANYPEATAHVSRLFRMRNFDFSLGGLQYFQFDRKLMRPNFSGSFLFGRNPFRFDTRVECVATEVPFSR